MNYTQSVGNIVELQCIAKFMELGYECSIPYGNGAKYDFIADIDGELLRIQCKAASVPINKSKGTLDDAFQISTISQTTNTQKTVKHTYSSEEIDYFATYFNGKVYLIPVEECSTAKTLRFSAPKINMPYNKAEDYEIEKRISYSNQYLQTKEEFLKRKNEKMVEFKEYYCKECNAKITKYSDSGLCASCCQKKARKVERPNREELKNLIRTKPFVQIGKDFGVTDNAIRKWCRVENLPSKKSDIEKYSDEDWSKI